MDPLPPTLSGLGNRIIDMDMIAYPATSVESTFIFYLREHEKLLQGIHGFKSFPYDVPGQPHLINRATLKSVNPPAKNPLGNSVLRKNGMVLGRLGYWPINERNPEEPLGFVNSINTKFGEIIHYIPRVIIDDHPNGKIYFTPLSQYDETVHLGRDLKVDEEMRRIVTKGPTGDYIANIFYAYAANREVADFPLVLRHNTITPWKTTIPPAS